MPVTKKGQTAASTPSKPGLSAWQKAREASRTGGNDLPEGAYIARISGAVREKSKASNREQVHWEYTVLEGDQTGQIQHSYEGIETESNLVFLLRKLRRLGYDVDEMEESELDDVLTDIARERPKVRIRVKVNGEFTNTYLDKLLPDEGDDWPTQDPSNEPEEAPEDEEEEPEEEEEAIAPAKGNGKAPRKAPGRRKKAPEPEPESEDVELAIGQQVAFTDSKGQEVWGTVQKISEKDGSLSVLVESGGPSKGKTLRVPADKVEALA